MIASGHEEPRTSSLSFIRRGLSSNIWLLFLLFPAISVGTTAISTTRKTVAIVLIALFAVVHMVAMDEEIRRGMGVEDAPSRARAPWWFTGLVGIVVAAVAFGGWGVLGVLPFLVAFAMFHFSWRGVVAVVALCMAVSILGPAFGGLLGELWFFSILVASVTAATAFIRIEEQHQGERRAFETHLAVSDERNRVARDVHDVLGHSLTAVILKAQVCDRLLQQLERDADDSPGRAGASTDAQVVTRAREQLAELNTVSRRALTEIRSTVGGLRSADLSDELTAARAVLADAEVELTVIGDPADFDAESRSMLGWVVREAVTNIVRHAHASSCRIEIGATASGEEGVMLRITDDGIGLGAASGGNGLTGLRERVEATGALLRTASQDGTVVEVLRPPTKSKL